MKKKTLLFILFLSTSIAFSNTVNQCNYSFVMGDEFGDGWNGNTMSIRQNGNSVATIGSTFVSGISVTVSVSLEDGVPFELFWNAGGSFSNEVRISIVNSLGQTIYTKPEREIGPNNLLYSGIVSCTAQSCTQPISFSLNNITQTSLGMTWTDEGTASQWEVLALPLGSPYPTGNQSGVLTSTNSFIFTGLTCGVSYRVYVRAICDDSNVGLWTCGPENPAIACDSQLATTCQNAYPLCDAFNSLIPCATNIPNQGAMGCLARTPNPTWFYFMIDSPGPVRLNIASNNMAGGSSGSDLDYIVYGPYQELGTPCSAQLTPDKIVGCRYSPYTYEEVNFIAPQAGQYYYLMVTNFNNLPGYIKISQLPQTPQAYLDCSGFRLSTFLDNNNNGVKDFGEPFFPQGKFLYEKNNDGIQHNDLSSTGELHIYEDNLSNIYDFGLVLNPDFASYYNITTASYNDVSVTGTGINVYNLPVTVATLYKDLSVSITALNPLIFGFTYKNKIVYTNNGNQTIAAGSISFSKENVLTITSNSQSGTVSSPNGFTYGFSNLLPFETRSMIVSMQVPVFPIIVSGGLLNNTVTGSILSGGDLVASNNQFTLSERARGAYDPNDITESHGEKILHSGFSSDDYLYYTIRFENTGTGPAINVEVDDVLDSKLDETSIQMVSSSHNYIMDRVGANINWEFKYIGLKTTAQNPNESKGYITYKIKPKPGYAIGDIIPNTASIYFDYNPAIVTNTFTTEFISQLSVDEFENASFGFYPNPVKDILTIVAKDNNSISEIVIYDIYGKQISKKKVTEVTTFETIDLSSYSKGMYLLEVSTNGKTKTLKKLLVE